MIRHHRSLFLFLRWKQWLEYFTEKTTKTNTAVWSWKWFSSRTIFCTSYPESTLLWSIKRLVVLKQIPWAGLLCCWCPAYQPWTWDQVSWQCSFGSTIVPAQGAFPNSCVRTCWLDFRQWSYLNFQCWDRRKGTLWPAVEVLAFRRDAL